jgi:hypothetical protein
LNSEQPCFLLLQEESKGREAISGSHQTLLAFRTHHRRQQSWCSIFIGSHGAGSIIWDCYVNRLLTP